MASRIKWILFSIIASILIFYSVCFAEIKPVSIEDIKDHEKITKKLNQIIIKLNSEIKEKSSQVDMDDIKSLQRDAKEDARDLRKMMKYQLGVDDKIVKKMINKGWISQHSEVEP